MKFFSNIFALCQMTVLGLKKWFLPLPYPDDVEEEEDVWGDDEKSDNPKSISDNGKKTVAGDSVTAISATDGGCEADAKTEKIVPLRDRMINVMILHNARTPSHVAEDLDKPVGEIRPELAQLVSQGMLSQDQKGTWFKLLESHRESLIHGSDLQESFSYMSDSAFQADLQSVLLKLLNNFPLSIIPSEHILEFQFQGRTVMHIMIYGNSLTVEMQGAVPDRIEELAQAADAPNAYHDDMEFSFDWQSYMDPTAVEEIFEDFLKSKKTKRQRRRRTKKSHKANSKQTE